MRSVLAVVVFTLLLVTGCGGSDAESNGNGSPSLVEQAFSEDVGISVSDARCVDDGSWNRDSTSLSWCSSLAEPGLYDGCYATEDGRDLTIAVRASEARGAHRCMGNALDQIRQNNAPELRDEFDVERALERTLGLSLDREAGATCGQQSARRYSCSVLDGPNDRDRGFIVQCGKWLPKSRALVGAGCRFRRMSVKEEAAFGIQNAAAEAYRRREAARQAAQPAEPTPPNQSAEAIAGRLRSTGHENVVVEKASRADGFTITLDEDGYRFLVQKWDSAANLKSWVADFKLLFPSFKTEAATITNVGPLLVHGFMLGGAMRPMPKARFEQLVRQALG